MWRRCRRCAGRCKTWNRWCVRPRCGPSPGLKNEPGRDMAEKRPIGWWASLSLLLALVLAVAGVIAEHFGVKFWGGLLLAFGEAALVGGLADWFAVRALFVHPFGIPFPHSALIPRNRRRIVAEVRSLVENEWLPRPMLISRVRGYDFVGEAILPFIGSHKETLRGLLRTVARNVVA